MLVTSGDIAAVASMTSGAVRAWERDGKIPKGKRAGGRGCRRWEAAEIAPILRGWGYTVPASWESEAVAA
jgi:hypothetical protein